MKLNNPSNENEIVEKYIVEYSDGSYYMEAEETGEWYKGSPCICTSTNDILKAMIFDTYEDAELEGDWEETEENAKIIKVHVATVKSVWKV